jgi:hypothetical protein
MTDPLYERRPSAWVGWIVLAAALMGLSGAFNVASGLIAVFSDTVYVDTPGSTTVLDVTGWGWVHVVWGVIIILTALSLAKGRPWGRIVAVLVVGFNALTQLLEMPAYPFYSLLIITIDVLILYAILLHGDELRES